MKVDLTSIKKSAGKLLDRFAKNGVQESDGRIVMVGDEKVVVPPRFAEICEAIALEKLQNLLGVKGMMSLKHFRGGNLIAETPLGPNTWTTEGMAWALNVLFGSTAKATAVYMGIFKNNVTPALADTAATKLGAAGAYGECQDADYTAATNRPAYTVVNTSTAVVTNSAAAASFTIVQSFTLYGAFLATSQAKTATTGVLICGKKLASARAVEATDVIAITYSQTLTTS